MKSHLPERRIHPRKPLNTKIIFNDEFGDGLFYLESKDISIGGLCLVSDIPAKTGSLMFISFQIPPHKRPVHITGQVVRRRKGIAAGEMGIRFIGMAAATQKRIENYIGSRNLT